MDLVDELRTIVGSDFVITRRDQMEQYLDDGGCNGCIQCCTRRSCPLLDTERNLCRSYGSFFWRYFNCGRYPENTAQIRHYDCPKWEMSDQP